MNVSYRFRVDEYDQWILFYICLVGDWVSPIPIYIECGRVTSQFHSGDYNTDNYVYWTSHIWNMEQSLWCDIPTNAHHMVKTGSTRIDMMAFPWTHLLQDGTLI